MIFTYDKETMRKSIFADKELFMQTAFDLSENDYLTMPMSSGKKAIYKLDEVKRLGNQGPKTRNIWYRVRLGAFKYL